LDDSGNLGPTPSRPSSSIGLRSGHTLNVTSRASR
jgi:hypothetical protein